MVLGAFRLAKITKQHKELLQLHSVQGGKNGLAFFFFFFFDFVALGASGSLTTWMENPGIVRYLWSWYNLLIAGPRLLKEEARFSSALEFLGPRSSFTFIRRLGTQTGTGTKHPLEFSGQRLQSHP